ncbi:MAG: Acetobutylicum phosphotransbutyrylase [Thermoleophilia bacterium]|nr:Acetobutylicum phosphotransbutyrylase [Thermoleophilia bacterium]
MGAWAALIFAASSRPDLRVSSDDALDLVLRKAAHIVVFGVLAVVVARCVHADARCSRRALLVAALITLAYAASDEWHQTFVEGRVGHPRDVVIDMFGALVALTGFARHSARPPVHSGAST